MASIFRAFVAALALVGVLSQAAALRRCTGTATYKVTFNMRWTVERFGDTVPADAVLSPLTAAAHTNSFVPFRRGGTASDEVEMVAEAGNNVPLVAKLEAEPRVGGVGFLSADTSNNGPASVTITVDADQGFTRVSAIGMLAPTPDWITFFNNVRVCRRGFFLPKVKGFLFAYDAGTEVEIGVDQQPRETIRRLRRPRYPQYQGVPVGYYTIEMM